jgi:hypothetical protein
MLREAADMTESGAAIDPMSLTTDRGGQWTMPSGDSAPTVVIFHRHFH